MNDTPRPKRPIAMGAMQALAMIAMLGGIGSDSAEPLPEPRLRPTPPRPVLGHGCAAPSRPEPKREPTKAELLAAERRKRKAARRIELARRNGR